MTITAFSAMAFLPFVLPICLWVAWSDMATMRIPNKAVMALFFVYAIVGIFVLPLDDYLWRYLHLVIILLLGIVLNAVGAVGAGDAKFAAAAAPLIALGDLRLLMVLFAANLLAAVATHRLAKISPLRRMAPNWESWNRGWDFPMGLSLGTTLAIYLILGALYGA